MKKAVMNTEYRLVEEPQTENNGIASRKESTIAWCREIEKAKVTES